VQLTGPPTRAFTPSGAQGLDSVERRGQHRAVVPVGPAQAETERRAARIGDDVALRARLAPLSVGFGPVAEPLFWPGQTHCPGSPGSSRFARPRADAPAAPDAGALDARLLPVAQTPPATHPAATAHLGPAAYPRAGPSTARTGCRSARPGSRSGDDRPSGVVGAVAEAGRSRPRDHRAEAGEPYQPTHAQTIRARSVRRSKAQSLCVANAPNLDWRPGFRSLFQKPRTFFYR
jgi:hypothetical protein